MRSEHEGTPAWREGIEASIRKVELCQARLTEYQEPSYRYALMEIKTMLQAMLLRGTETSTTPID